MRALNYGILHSARKKLESGQKLTREEKDELLFFLEVTEGAYYPSEEELQNQIFRLKKLEEMAAVDNNEKDDEFWREFTLILEQCNKFSNNF